MRIIAGRYRGRRLRAPGGRSIRPTSDRLRETIFNIIGADIQGQNIVDIFAGTGAMGIEALSRGAAHAVFIDKDPRALECVRTNIVPLDIAPQWEIIRCDVGRNLSCLGAFARHFDCAFVDPPYNKGLAARSLGHLTASGAMRAGGLIVLEHALTEKLDINLAPLILWDQRRYGKTLVTFLRSML